jgi:hypothetical protein
MKKECAYCEWSQNPVMAEARLHINSFIIGSLFTVLALIFTFSQEKISFVIISQMVISIPLILFASLSYAKVGYERSHRVWYRFGWITNNLGYLLFLNSVGLMIVFFSWRMIGFLYFGVTIFLVGLYYLLNISSQPGTTKEHLLKLFLWLIVIIVGGIVPSLYI